ncbi:MAG TPA: AraC family transcriptional regulator [Tepidimicrobium sp.]|nr:AraC family transcriptional regulator [Tepidimicrobium sp.]
MIQYENKLLHCFIRREYDSLIPAFNKLFKASYTYFKRNPRTFRSMKNYFITINSIIYKTLYDYPICKRKIYKARNSYNHNIEICKDMDELYEACKDMVTFYSQIKGISEEPCSHPVITNTIKYIHDNLNEDLTLERLAKEVHVSKNYLSLLFSKFVGLSLSDYINKLRIEKAKELLKNRNSFGN